MEDNIERQQLEVEALESIYEDLNVTNNKGIVNLKIELEQPIQLNGNEILSSNDVPNVCSTANLITECFVAVTLSEGDSLSPLPVSGFDPGYIGIVHFASKNLNVCQFR